MTIVSSRAASFEDINKDCLLDELVQRAATILCQSTAVCSTFTFIEVDPGGLGVIILASGCEVRGFDPGRGRWIFSERKNPTYDFLRKGSKAVGPVS